MPEITIDGRAVEAEAGETILNAAKRAGIYIPTLCNLPQLPPFGGCRMCLVKVEGMKKYVPSCATPVRDGMVVQTNIEELNRLRRNILELILSEHPSACIVCDDREECFKYNKEPTKAGRITGCRFCPVRDDCELYEIAKYLGIDEIRVPIEYRNMPLKRDEPFIERDYDMCVLCGRCVRTCDEVRGVHAIDFTHRGHETVIGTSFDEPLIDSGCIFCGACVDVCPTGALTEKRTKWGGTADETVQTTCMLCPVGCSLDVEVKWGKVMNSLPSEESGLCVKGRFTLPTLVTHPDRMEYPMIRENGVLKPVSWDEAIEYAAKKLKAYKPGEVAFVITPWMTNEGMYAAQKTARAMGTDNIGIASEMAAPSIARSGYRGAIGDIENADTIIVAGTDLNLSAPVLLTHIYRAKKKGAKVIIVDSHAKKLPLYIDMHISPESYLSFFREAAEAIEGKGKLKNGSEAVRLAELMGKKVCIIFGKGIFSGGGGAEALSVISDMASSLNATLLPAWDGGNVQGAIDAGCMAGWLPGRLSLSDKNARDKIEKLWKMKLPDAGLNPIYNCGSIKALYITQPVSEIPESVEFLVLQDVYKSELMERADVVFPAAAFTEEEGTITLLDGSIKGIAKCSNPAGMAMEDWNIFSKLAAATGHDFGYENAGDIAEEMKRCATGGGAAAQAVEKGKEDSYNPVLGIPEGEICYRGAEIGGKVEDFAEVLKAWRYND